MTIPFWCLFAVAFLPYVWFAVAGPARVSQLGKGFDPHAPRVQEILLRGFAARAQGAHANALEALAYFTPAVVVNHLAHADPEWSARFAIAFVVFRVGHGIAYLGDRPPLRTLSQVLGLISSIGLFVLAARA
jgi:uncharacterized MAPEG superfamily protein